MWFRWGHGADSRQAQRSVAAGIAFAAHYDLKQRMHLLWVVAFRVCRNPSEDCHDILLLSTGGEATDLFSSGTDRAAMVKEVARGITAHGRSKSYHRRGLWAIKEKNGGKVRTRRL